MKKMIMAAANVYEELYDSYVEQGILPPREEVDEILKASDNHEWDAELGICYQLDGGNSVIEKYNLKEDPDNEGWYFDPKYI